MSDSGDAIQGIYALLLTPEKCGFYKYQTEVVEFLQSNWWKPSGTAVGPHYQPVNY
jgi:hypothetical protein